MDRSGISAMDQGVTVEQELIARIRAIDERLERIEKRLSTSTEKESYTIQEAAERLDKAKWTVRQWCNLGQAMASKIRSSGRHGEWRIPHEEVTRLNNEGPKAPGSFNNQVLNRKAS